MMIFMCGFAVVFNLAALVSHVNTLVVDGYDPITLFFCTLQGMTTLLAFGLTFREIIMREEFRRYLK